MVYSSVDAYRPAQAWLYPDDMNDEYSMSHWQNHFIGHEPPLDMYYNPSGRQLAHSHHDYHDHLGGSLPYAVQEEFTPVFYHSPPQDLHHPYYNSPSTLCDSSSASSGTLSPVIETRATSLLPSSDYNDCGAATCGYGPHGCDTSDEAYADTSCITMQIVQKTADTLHDEPAGSFDTYVNHEPQELVFAEPSHDDPTPSEYDQDSITVAHVERRNEMTPETEQDAACESETDSEYEPQPAPAVRRRRAPAQQSRPSTLGRSRITKTSSPGRQRSSPAKPSSSNQDSTRAFLCPLAPYGCTAVFNAKNEWKRHATTQHFQLGFWRCDQCTHPPSRPNDFNRKDLYIQHVRRMHPPTAAAMPSNDKRNTNTKRSGSQSKVDAVEVVLNEAAGRCYQRMRSAPESCCCVFCDEKFEGETALESRLEHVGKHMEKQRKVGLEPVAVQDWREDEELEAWLLHHGLLVRRRGRLEVSK